MNGIQPPGLITPNLGPRPLGPPGSIHKSLGPPGGPLGPPGPRINGSVTMLGPPGPSGTPRPLGPPSFRPVINGGNGPIKNGPSSGTPGTIKFYIV